FGGDIVAGAWSFLDDDGLPEPFREPLSHQPRDDVGRSAGSESHDPPNRPRRIGLRPRDVRREWQCGSARSQMQKLSAGKFHGVLPDHFAEIKLGAALTATLITSTAYRMLAGRSAPTLSMERFGTPPLAARLTCYLSIRLMRKGAPCPEVAVRPEGANH